jgi:uncharacterized Fe-S cluster-containing protein
MKTTVNELPGLDCGVCGFRTCAEMAVRLETEPQMLKRCIHLSSSHQPVPEKTARPAVAPQSATDQAAAPCRPVECVTCATARPAVGQTAEWHDSLGREFDFYLEHFPEDPGPREIIIPHNPMITREMEIKPGDVLIGRPLGMSCGCPITHCGIAMNVDVRTGVIVWCVTGPLRPRQQGCKDLGYYIAEGYEGLATKARCELKIGMRYYFQPRMCMLQWRHSGLVNYLNRSKDGLQIRVEGLWIG